MILAQQLIIQLECLVLDQLMRTQKAGSSKKRAHNICMSKRAFTINICMYMYLLCARARQQQTWKSIVKIDMQSTGNKTRASVENLHVCGIDDFTISRQSQSEKDNRCRRGCKEK
jgi:hypothetical protein